MHKMKLAHDRNPLNQPTVKFEKEARNPLTGSNIMAWYYSNTRETSQSKTHDVDQMLSTRSPINDVNRARVRL